MPELKERSEAIARAARTLLDERQIDISQQVELRPLALLLTERTGCAYTTAKRHIARAVRLMRGEMTAPQWGGSRPGAGRPKDE